MTEISLSKDAICSGIENGTTTGRKTCRVQEIKLIWIGENENANSQIK